jgi:hypothetical protein
LLTGKPAEITMPAIGIGVRAKASYAWPREPNGQSNGWKPVV